ncbi:MAG: HAD family hydrolase [Flavobacteriaceae bacterium]
MKDYNTIRTIGFDADDTLWVNETYFRETEDKFADLLQEFETKNKIDNELFAKEMENLRLYGYGVKGFMLSMLETAIELSSGQVNTQTLSKIIAMGKRMIDQPVEILDGVQETLQYLAPKYRLIVMTKGDLLDQERKLQKSGLSKYFQHVEVLSDKKEKNYSDLLAHLEIDVDEFVMIGNSLKSDVLPLLNIGAKAIHIPFHTTWAHEEVSEKEIDKDHQYLKIERLTQLKSIF